MSLNQQFRKGVPVLAGVSDADYLGEIGRCATVEVRKGVWNTGDPLGHLLVLPCPYNRWKTISTQSKKDY